MPPLPLQLFINYKLKSVAHLPWRMMTYKALNTFIDDIFAFVIKMPTMYRIGCFRDDVVFFIFLYQKYVYRVSLCWPHVMFMLIDVAIFEAQNPIKTYINNFPLDLIYTVLCPFPVHNCCLCLLNRQCYIYFTHSVVES